MRTLGRVIIGLALLLVPLAAGAQDDPAANARRVQELRAKRDRGEPLTPDDRAFVQKMLAQQRGTQGKAAPRPKSAATPTRRENDSPGNWSALVPLTELTGTYQGEDGGLYGQGRNEPPAAHWEAYLKASEQIVPRATDGRPAGDGKIGLITIGFSNTNLVSIEFKKTADADPQKSPNVVVVNGAIGSRAAVMWAYDGADALPKQEQERLDKEMDTLHMPKAGRRGKAGLGDKDTWPTLDLRLKEAGLAPQQVQALWMKHVEAGPRPLGDFPAHAKALEADMADILIIAKKRFPNLRVAYLSSRTYAGWAGPNCGSPEPFAYECAFAVRWLIQRQIAGDARLNFDPARGDEQSPLLLWGPYLWAQGDTPRKSDGMVWSSADVRADDHMHPSELGCKKATALLMNFLKTDAGARRWFLAPGAGPVVPVDVKALAAGLAQPDAAGVVRPAPAADDFHLDPQRVRRLMEKSNAGEQLSPEDRAYLDRARQAIRQRTSQPGGKAKNAEPIDRDPSVNDPKMVAALVPLDELTGDYHGEDGGLYGQGRNEPPAAHLAAAGKETAKICPLDAAGRPEKDGKIVVLSLGLSNTTMEFSEFKRAADADPRKSARVVIVDGAQGGRPAASWALSGAAALPAAEADRLRKEIDTIGDRMPKTWKSEWEVVAERLQAAGVTPQQVQVLWLKEGTPMPGRFGEFPAHARAMQADISDMLLIAKRQYPNLRIAYLSSRTFGGYAFDTRNPEPYAYENAFSVRWVIQAQIQGDARLNFDSERGPATAPLLLWGPYLWTNGTHPRKSDGLVWERADASQRDGMHPSPSGRKKVVDLLLAFFKTDVLARKWFVEP